ncbi:uncharacterized protein LOC132726889 [Ruditapes philippinarum]|uniref:uncharacterized protein LOC132726889 n=1 Tax=Ruditapes philippinarum TaxID=129788 RepID=UPI00295B52CD|nr:uncharacterized protein LOC132726889 [Ruditapes philippinarum]
MIFPVKSNFSVSDSKLKDDVKYQLMTIYKGYMGETFKDLVINRISAGSLVVDFDLIYDNDTPAASKDIAEANIALLSGGSNIEVLNETVSATSLKVNGVIVTNTTLSDHKSVCNMYEALNGMCPSNQHCIAVDSQPSCVFNEVDKNNGLARVIVMVVVAIVALTIIVLITLLVIRKIRRMENRNLPDEEKKFTRRNNRYLSQITMKSLSQSCPRP